MSYKQLKSQASKGKKGKQANPEHSAYVAAMKGMQSAIVDVDYYRFEDGATLLIVGEESSAVRAFMIKDMSKESEFVVGQGKLQAGVNIVSVSIGPMRITDSKSFSMLVAVALFDHCSVQFFELSRTSADPSNLVFKHLPDKTMTSIHKIPICMLRMSKKHPGLMVTCGDESDLYIKLWNLASSKLEPVTAV